METRQGGKTMATLNMSKIALTQEIRDLKVMVLVLEQIHKDIRENELVKAPEIIKHHNNIVVTKLKELEHALKDCEKQEKERNRTCINCGGKLKHFFPISVGFACSRNCRMDFIRKVDNN